MVTKVSFHTGEDVIDVEFGNNEPVELVPNLSQDFFPYQGVTLNALLRGGAPVAVAVQTFDGPAHVQIGEGETIIVDVDQAQDFELSPGIMFTAEEVAPVPETTVANGLVP